jgi:hypothetical protein
MSNLPSEGKPCARPRPNLNVINTMELLGGAIVAAGRADEAAAYIEECKMPITTLADAANRTRAHLHYGAAAVTYTTALFHAHNSVYDIEGPSRQFFIEWTRGLHTKWECHTTTAIKMWERRKLLPPIIADGVTLQQDAYRAVARAVAMVAGHHSAPEPNPAATTPQGTPTIYDIREHDADSNSSPPRLVPADSENLIIIRNGRSQTMHWEQQTTTDDSEINDQEETSSEDDHLDNSEQ